MTQIHEASLKPGQRKPKSDWTRSAAEEAKFQAMQAKCRKNAKVEVNGNSEDVQPQSNCEGSATNVLDAVQTSSAPSVAAPQLKWSKPEKYHCKTRCNRYSVAKCFVMGKATYQVWVLVPGCWFIQHGPTASSFAEAQGIAEAHAVTNPFRGEVAA